MAEEKKAGYATTTYKIKLNTRHMDWLRLTKLRYNQALAFYYRLLLSQADLLALSNHNLLRRLEILSIGEKKSGKKAEYPLPYEKIPLYFRRAAINAAISMVRSQKKRGQKEEAGNFQASPVYYKGMYKQFENGHILLKLWNGNTWSWVKYDCSSSRKIPANAKCLSPSIKVNRKTAMLHMPVTVPVEDVRTIRERAENGDKICAVAFPGNKNLAVCTCLNSDGRFERAFFIKGGGEWKHRRKRCLRKGRKDKIHNLAEDFAHKTSRKIVDYCLKNQVKIIAAPKYKNGLSLNRKGYLKASDYDWIGRRIIRYLKYKAFQAGIIVTEIPAHHSSSKCYICGGRIKKYNEGYRANVNFYGGRLYECPSGHRGNTALNAAKNLGNYFQNVVLCQSVS